MAFDQYVIFDGTFALNFYKLKKVKLQWQNEGGLLIMTLDGFFAVARMLSPWGFVLKAIMYGLSDDGSKDARLLASLFCLITAGGCFVILK